MDPIFDRLGRLIRSWGTDSRDRPASTVSSDRFQKEAEEELEEFLRTGREGPKKTASHQRTAEQGPTSSNREPPPQAVYPNLAQAFAILGIPSRSSWEQINAAHRALLKKHHPDGHAGNEAQVKQATAQSQKINEAYQVLKKHFGR